MGELESVLRGRNVSMEVQKDLRNSIILPTIPYGNEVWMWSESEQATVRAVKTNYLRATPGVLVMDRMNRQEIQAVQ